MKENLTALKNIPTLPELKSILPGVRSFLFDMDGTLFNTEKYHALAMILIGQKYHIIPPHSEQDVHALMMGKADYLVFDLIKDWPGVPKTWTVDDFVTEKNKNLLKILEETNPQDFFPQASLRLLQKIKNAGYFLGLVTSSEEIVTNALLKLAGIEDLFEIKLTRDNCPKHKPDPWPYLRAIELSGKSVGETLIFEDSDIGIRAALGAHAHVIKVEWL